MHRKENTILSLLLLIALSGCGGAPAGSATTTTTNTSGTVVTDNPRSIIQWSQLNGKTNLAATMRVNDKGTTVTQIPVTISRASVQSVNLGGLEETGVETLNCQPTNGRGVYEGDSGSPVLVSGDVASGLFGSSDGVHFDARGIEQMESTASGPPVARPGSLRTPIAREYIRGPAEIMQDLKAKPGFGSAIYEGDIGPQAAKPIVGGGASIIPGLRYASPFVLGTYVEGYDLATYTYEMSNGRWVATGHGLEDAGAVSWPIMAVSVIGPNADGSIHANLIGSIYGTLLYDGEKGSLIDPSTPAPTMPVTVNVTYNGLPKPVSSNKVRFDLGSSTEDTSIESAAQSTLQAQLKGASSSFGGSGQVRFVVNGGTLNKALAFPGGESLSGLVSSAGSQIDSVLTAQHNSAPSNQIQSVTISLTING